MTDRELMQQALDALENSNVRRVDVEAAIAALRERLARQEQKPVAWANFAENGNIRIWSQKPPAANWANAVLQPLYTAPQPRQWQGLTEPERLACYDLNPARFASAVEAKLKEKNT